MNLSLAKRTNKDVKLVGLSVNSSNLGEEEALKTMAELEDIHQVPVVDPVRTGVARLVDFLEQNT